MLAVFEMFGRAVLFYALAALAGCGRFGDDRVAAAGPSPDASSAPADACTPVNWTAPAIQPFALINTPAIEWAPEISDDGLRLIFASDRQLASVSGHQHMYLATRQHQGDVFSSGAALSFSDPAIADRDPSSNDRELYYISNPPQGECIYVATQTEITTDPISIVFGTPRRLDPLCASGTLGSLYISHDGAHLYYDIRGANPPLLMASRPDTSQDFTQPGTPVAGIPTSASFCSLTDDELTVFCESTIPASTLTQIIQLTRPSLVEPFGNLTVVSVGPAGISAGDPSVRPDAHQLVYASDVNNEDLAIVDHVCQ